MQQKCMDMYYSKLLLSNTSNKIVPNFVFFVPKLLIVLSYI